MQESIVFLLRVQCPRKESSRSLSHLLMSFLLVQVFCQLTVTAHGLLVKSLPSTEHNASDNLDTLDTVLPASEMQNVLGLFSYQLLTLRQGCCFWSWTS